MTRVFCCTVAGVAIGVGVVAIAGALWLLGCPVVSRDINYEF